MPDTTICAVATPPGRGGIGVIRVSGPTTASLIETVVGPLPSARRASFRRFAGDDGVAIDEGLVLWFPGPHSFTGEDVAELHGHGGPVVMDRLLQRLLGLGAELASPGEFSQRAYSNGRIDLTRAEAIADLIEAGSESAARAAVRSLQGEFAQTVERLVRRLTDLRVHLEAGIDFADEPLEGLALDGVVQRIEAIAAEVAETRRAAGRGQRLQEGLTVVIAGRPNAGKSSLLNALAGRDAAIVTALAGTTRDVLDTYLHIDGLPLRVLDTAGLRQGGDVVEQEGVRRARQAMREADRILLVTDDTAPALAADDSEITDLQAELPASVPVTTVVNKIDLSGRTPGVANDGFAVSALTGDGMAALREHLRASLGEDDTEAVFIARRRHLQSLDAGAAAIDEALEAAHAGAGEELVAESLGEAQRALGEITGAVTPEDLLGRIFSTFCIGK
ncbi:tRNA uridine-5-carboxymethylaminomethyl(34) synthesis GTPase MnmE [Spiribacter vilamensis]|uniref:tRNA modification GTPase MnmE n=1 Tax=Spiribacter vilamensis TaxID=531306 RepID=A0A4Q8D2J0_9GAMM|nr:tRNA uridine-5-carboxymethylaminomethyl(34) synthesis GTPase MnmE [Spiribacter vilamensis]RZU99527.1 tRNA modification GTPase trmE [Spiribacter vilamensis]TVO61503.1 tRNA uridine-5-carboxymethylaminomethyl(34) synthesis GTPase MnmE [Spiribacter vilamensis]